MNVSVLIRAVNQSHMVSLLSHGAQLCKTESKLSSSVWFYLSVSDSVQSNSGNKYTSVICCYGNCCQHEHQLLCESRVLKGLALRERQAGKLEETLSMIRVVQQILISALTCWRFKSPAVCYCSIWDRVMHHTILKSVYLSLSVELDLFPVLVFKLQFNLLFPFFFSFVCLCNLSLSPYICCLFLSYFTVLQFR